VPFAITVCEWAEAVDRLCAAVGEDAARLPPSLAQFRQRMLQRRLIEAWCASGGVYTKFTASPKEAEVCLRWGGVGWGGAGAEAHGLPKLDRFCLWGQAVLFMHTCLSQCLMGSLSPPPPHPPPPPRVHHQLRPVVAALWKSFE
jgi:hypothetical protein